MRRRLSCNVANRQKEEPMPGRAFAGRFKHRCVLIPCAPCMALDGVRRSDGYKLREVEEKIVPVHHIIGVLRGPQQLGAHQVALHRNL